MGLSFWCVFWSLGFSVLKWRFLVSLCSVILVQVRCDFEVVSKPLSALFRMLIWTQIRHNSHNIKRQSGALGENPVQAALHCQWFRMKSTVDFQLKLSCTRSAVNIQCRSGFVFLSVFWKYGFADFKCSFLVNLCRPIVDQVCWMLEMLPLGSRSCQWTVKYTVPYGKINLLYIRFTM